MDNLDEFVKWIISASAEITEIGKLLNAKLSDQPEVLKSQITTIEAYFWRTHRLMSESEMYLDIAQWEALKTSQGKNATEKKYWVDYAVRKERLFRNYLEGLTKSIAKRIEAGQSILAYEREKKVVV